MTVDALTGAIGFAVEFLMINIAWPELPFTNRLAIVFLATLVMAFAASRLHPTKREVSTVNLVGVRYRTFTVFNLAGAGVILIPAALYTIWW